MTEWPLPADLLPHRGRWLLLERIDHVEEEQIVATGRFAIDYTEGHFPQQPIVPGVALLEGLAQTMGCLARISDPEVQGTPFLAGFDRVRFRAPVIPPAVVEYRLKVVQRRMGMTKASGEVWCGGKKVCTARLMGAITTIS